MKKWFINNKEIIACAGVLFLLFYYISSRTPIAGDGWGYALRGQSNNPFVLSWLFYLSWSGRFFSELWGFVMSPRIELWNVVNALLFVTIFVFVMKLQSSNKNKLLSCLFALVLMLSVEDSVRMQTYTWVMGTTYVVPLAFSLIYFYLIKRRYLENNPVKLDYVFTNFLLFYSGLTMENISGTLVLAAVILLIYFSTKDKKIDRFLLMNLIVIGISFALIRMSPGATDRLLRDHPDWFAMNLFEQITANARHFIVYTFTNNQTILIGFTALLAIRMIQNKEVYVNKFLYWGTLFWFAIAIFFCTNTNYSSTVFSNGMSLTGWLYFGFWMIYVVLALVAVWMSCKRKEEVLFYVLLGGASSACMMLSPIFSSRSMLYFVYFILVATMILLDEIEITSITVKMGSLVLILLISALGYRYYKIYSQVATIQAEREGIIEYHIHNPEEKEVWMPRMPENTIHSANIEPENEYHMKSFKEYYGLDEDKLIIFYNIAD